MFVDNKGKTNGYDLKYLKNISSIEDIIDRINNFEIYKEDKLKEFVYTILEIIIIKQLDITKYKIDDSFKIDIFKQISIFLTSIKEYYENYLLSLERNNFEADYKSLVMFLEGLGKEIYNYNPNTHELYLNILIHDGISKKIKTIDNSKNIKTLRVNFNMLNLKVRISLLTELGLPVGEDLIFDIEQLK